MRQNPQFSRQVEELNIPECYNKRHFHFLFSNLRIVKNVTKSIVPDRVTQPKNVRLGTPAVPFNGRLQHIEDSLQYPIIDKLLTSGYCSHITRLTLIEGLDETISKVFSHLSEAPMIKYLKLIRIFLTIMDFNLINGNLPLMQEFKLYNCAITGSTFPIDIVPDYALSTLEIKSAYAGTKAIESSFQRYIVAKYPKLQHFSYTKYLGAYPYIDLINLLQNQYPFMLKTFGKHLKSLSITLADQMVPSIFEVLDDCECQLNDLSLSNVEYNDLEGLGRSVQSRFIKSLSLYNVLGISFKWLKEMKLLEKLLIDHTLFRDTQNRSLKLCQLFSECSSTLESVTIRSFLQLHFNTVSPNEHIKELNLSGHCLSPGSDLYIGGLFPNLNRLHAEFIHLRNSTISFPYHHFTVLDLKAQSSKFAIKILADDKKLFFNLKPYTDLTDYSILEEGIIPVQQKVFDNMPFVTIVVGSVKKLILEDVPAYF